MKAGYYLGGLALGLIIGGGIGYMIASDPKKKAKIDDFLADAGEKIADLSDKVSDIGNRVKSGLGLDGYDCDDLSEEEIVEIEAVLAAKIGDEHGVASKKAKNTK